VIGIGAALVIIGVLGWAGRPGASRAITLPASGASPQSTQAAPVETASRAAAPQRMTVTADPVREGVAAYNDGDLEGSLASFERSVAQAPNDPEALNNLGQVLVRLGRVREAIAKLQAAVSLSPDSWSYRFNLARALGLAGDWSGAVASYREADRLFPDDHVTMFNLALALRKTGQFADAVPLLERVHAQQPDDPSFLLTLADTYEFGNKPKEAAAAFQQYLDAAPDGPESATVKARLARLTAQSEAPTAVAAVSERSTTATATTEAP
jgi:Flp pilus assembly protein TadD